MSTTFDPLIASAKLLLEASPRGRRLSWGDHYAIFALLQSGVKQEVISNMFGISLSSISHLANCLAPRPQSIRRYPHVFREWRLLGRDEFIKAYLTEEHVLQADRIKRSVAGALDTRDLSINPHADSCAYKMRGPVQVEEDWFRIDWIECDHPEIPPEKKGPIGWRYALIDELDQPKEPYVSISPYETDPPRPDGVWMPWRTSGDVFDWLFVMRGLKSPRRPGRPRK